MFDILGRGVARHPAAVLAVWLAVGLSLAWTAPPWAERCQDDDVRFMPERCMSVRGHQLLQEAFPHEVFGSKLVLAIERPDAPLTPADYALADRVVAELQDLRRTKPELTLGHVASYRDPLVGTRYRSEDRHCTLILVPMETPFLGLKTGDTVKAIEARVGPILDEYAASESAVGRTFAWASTGPSAIGRDLNDAVYQSLDDTTIATVILVVITLLMVYRSPVMALVPLATIGVSVFLSLKILALLTLWPAFQVVNITEIFIVVVLFGAGTDYCLFLISRYREELQNGHSVEEAVHLSLRHVGGALTASAGTVVVGLAMMGFAEFAKLRYCGPAIALSLVVALAASLTLMPALLRLLGRWAFWPIVVVATPSPPTPLPRSGGEGSPNADSVAAGFSLRRPKPAATIWDWLSAALTRRPLRIWLASTLLLVPFAIIGYRTQHVVDMCDELPLDASSRRGLEMIQRHFVPGELGPVTVLLQSDRDWNHREQRALIARISEELSGVPNVAEVRSLTQPLGKPLDGPSAKAGEVGEKPALLSRLPKLTNTITDQVARGYYLAKTPNGRVTRIDVVLHTEPFAPESTATLQAVKSRLDAIWSDRGEQGKPAPRCEIYGITPLNADFAEVHESDRVRVQLLILGGILLILIAVVRRPFFACYLLITVIFSYYVTIGFTELVTGFWFGAPVGQVDWKVPYFLFTILVAVGEDYNIFLMSRVLEESKRVSLTPAPSPQRGERGEGKAASRQRWAERADWFAGARLALARTGPTITSCGLIMAGTFATLMLCKLQTLMQLGLALAFGVLLETFVVRPILVPAMLMILHRRKPPTLTLAPAEPTVESVRQAA